MMVELMSLFIDSCLICISVLVIRTVSNANFHVFCNQKFEFFSVFILVSYDPVKELFYKKAT